LQKELKQMAQSLAQVLILINLARTSSAGTYTNYHSAGNFLNPNYAIGDLENRTTCFSWVNPDKENVIRFVKI
jgi:hypothetical protein